jgi:group II intron reverse transcriptase/maturase
MLSERTIKALDGIRKCSTTGKAKVRDLFEIMLKHPDLWLQAYANIYANKGAGTRGIDDVTQDGFSDERVNSLIKQLKAGSYFPKPSKRIGIPKANGKRRPLGIPSGDDKLVQEVVRMILETIYEPIFSDHSHGFRPDHSCHTALETINTWKGVTWLIEFDIKGFYDHIDHQILVQILAKKIDDAKFLQLIRRMLRAGYMEDWKFHKTYSGTPQGSIVSPILANLYLNELDDFMLKLKGNYERGKKRADNPPYRRIVEQKNRLRKRIKRLTKRGDTRSIELAHNKLKELSQRQRSIPTGDPADPNFRRLRYCRYADDFLIGLIGPKEEAKAIKDEVEAFLANELKLELSAEKTGVKHANDGTLFLGYEVRIATGDKTMKVKAQGSYATKRTIRGVPTLSVPAEKIKRFCASKGYGQWETMRSRHRPELLERSDAEIISIYNAELRGLANYYAMAVDVKAKLCRLFYIAHNSLAKTLANKHKTRKAEIFSRLRQNKGMALRYEVKGKARVLKVFKLTELKVAPRKYQRMDVIPLGMVGYSTGTELLRRWNAQECEICGQTEGYFEVHHVKKLADIKDGKQRWQRLMMARNRKTLVLCVECHDLLHAGKLQSWKFKDHEMESRVP